MVNVPPVYSSGLSCFAFALPTSSLHFADSPNKLIMLAFCWEAFRRQRQGRGTRTTGSSCWRYVSRHTGREKGHGIYMGGGGSFAYVGSRSKSASSGLSNTNARTKYGIFFVSYSRQTHGACFAGVSRHAVATRCEYRGIIGSNTYSRRKNLKQQQKKKGSSCRAFCCCTDSQKNTRKIRPVRYC